MLFRGFFCLEEALIIFLLREIGVSSMSANWFIKFFLRNNEVRCVCDGVWEEFLGANFEVVGVDDFAEFRAVSCVCDDAWEEVLGANFEVGVDDFADSHANCRWCPRG